MGKHSYKFRKRAPIATSFREGMLEVPTKRKAKRGDNTPPDAFGHAFVGSNFGTPKKISEYRELARARYEYVNCLGTSFKNK
jgi:hypothetical protein